MKRLNYLIVVMMATCIGFAFAACGDEEDEALQIIDPVVKPDTTYNDWIADTYIGTTLTDLDSRGVIMHIDTTYNQPITIEKNSLGQLTLTYHNWTDHTGMSYGDFCIQPIEAIATEGGVTINGFCTDSLYKAGVGYPATLRVSGTITPSLEEEINLTINIDLAVSPKMTLKFTLTYNSKKNDTTFSQL